LITVDKQDAVTLKITTEMSESKKLDLDMYIFVPGELGLTSDVMTESEFFYSSIHQSSHLHNTA